MRGNGDGRGHSDGHTEGRGPVLDPAHLRAEIARMRALRAEVDDIEYEFELAASEKKFGFGKRKFRKWVETPPAVPGSIDEINTLVDEVSDKPELIVPTDNLPAAANAIRDMFAAEAGYFEWGAPAKVITSGDGELPQIVLLTIEHVVCEVHERRREAPERQRFGDYVVTRFNALRHGVLSRYTVLPWEDENEYGTLVEALVAEHRPRGPTEEHLVEELAGIFWRKRRLRLADNAACHRGLKKTTEPHRETVKAALVHLDVSQQIEGVTASILATSESTAREIIDLEEDEAMTVRALDVLRAGKAKAYAEALSALREDTRNWWEEVLGSEPEDYEEDEKPYAANAADLLRFVEEKVVPWYEGRRKELKNRPLIRAQAFGEALDPERMERLGRYEVHLDRKLERTLAMLIRLQDLPRPGNAS